MNILGTRDRDDYSASDTKGEKIRHTGYVQVELEEKALCYCRRVS